MAIGGIPPSGIFFTKLSILSVAMTQFPYVTAAILIALTVVFAAFIRHGSAMIFGEPPAAIPRNETSRWTVVSVIFLATVFLILCVWIPTPLNSLITSAAATIK